METLVKNNEIKEQKLESIIKKLNSYMSIPYTDSVKKESEALATWRDERAVSDLRW